MNPSYQKILEDVKNDRRSGAWVIARKTIHCLETLAKEKSNSSVSHLSDEVERVAREILKAQPAMAQLTNLFNVIFLTSENATSDDALILSRKIAGEAARFDEQSKKAVAKISELGADLIGQDSVVLIHSNSSTVFEIIKKADDEGKSFQVINSESRPICEGRSCAEKLSQLGIQTTYLVDAAISKGVERADVVLLGADSLSENTLVNKIGSKAISLLSKEAVVPCYAACESSKFMPQKLNPKKERERDPKEVWEGPPSETTVENYYFDEIPVDLFNGIITEDGILPPGEIGSKIGARKISTKLLEMLK